MSTLGSALRRVSFDLARRLPPPAVRMINLARGIEAPRLVDLPPGRRVAVIAPHPDDELVGAGGTMAKHLAAGDPVTVIMLTSGEASASFVGQGAGSARQQREDEARAGLAEIGLGPGNIHFLHVPEKELTAGAGASAAGRLKEALGESGATVVYSPSPADGHAGHAAAARLLASVVGDLPAVRHIALYEVMTPVYPTVVVDVTAHMDAKLAGLRRYTSALASFDLVRCSEGMGAYRSVHCMHGRGYAEAFTLLRPEELISLVGGG